MTQLRNRFNGSAAGLHRLLYFLGLDPASRWIRGWLCFAVTLQANLFIFLVRSLPHLSGFLINLSSTVPLLDRSIRLCSICFIHLTLLLKLGRILESFCHRLNSVDLKLHRPNLSQVRKLSIAGVVWILLVCNSQVICAMCVEFLERKKASSFPFLEALQQFIRIESYLILDVSVLTFSACGHLLVIFYEQLAEQIIVNASLTKLFFFSTMSTQLSAAVTFLCIQFAFTLLINCIHSFFSLLFFTDSLITEIVNPELRISAVWDSIVLIDCLVRLWLICHTVDKIRNAARRSIGSLRKLRDNYSPDITLTYQRNQVTLAILEIARTLPTLTMYGLVTLSKELLLRVTLSHKFNPFRRFLTEQVFKKVMETTTAYVLMLNELKT